MLFGRRYSFIVEIIKFTTHAMAAGVGTTTDDEEIFDDAPKLAQKFAQIKPYIKNYTTPWAFVVITGKKADDGSYNYFLGNLVTREDKGGELANFSLPDCEFAKITVSQNKSMAISKNIEKARQYFHNNWLPKSEYKLSDELTDIEYYDSRSNNKPSMMELYFPICKK